MSGRRKFSELEANMSLERRARVERLAAQLEKKIDAATKSDKARAGKDQQTAPQTLTTRSGAAG
jgi:hypothetical protein